MKSSNKNIVCLLKIWGQLRDIEDEQLTTAEKAIKQIVLSSGICTSEATLNIAEKAIKRCTRTLPHVCGVNGPCNGWPR